MVNKTGIEPKRNLESNLQLSFRVNFLLSEESILSLKSDDPFARLIDFGFFRNSALCSA
jgi:hypothetical protein